MYVLLLPHVSFSIKGREKATVTKPIIFTYLLLPASRHVILNAVGDPGAASESWEYGFHRWSCHRKLQAQWRNRQHGFSDATHLPTIRFYKTLLFQDDTKKSGQKNGNLKESDFSKGWHVHKRCKKSVQLVCFLSLTNAERPQHKVLFKISNHTSEVTGF